MAEFPRLKTGALAQDGLECGYRTQTEVLRYVDGGQQAVKTRRGRKHWTVKLERLDEGELALVNELVETVRGETGTFAFTDPKTGVRHEACRIEGGSFEAYVAGLGDGRAELKIVEEID
ncbi:MAG TPA: hypothetical protein PKJ41_03540 [Bryobacteraceae bacterium]|nr:hypothetical protein [Bryobacteraceae bacterium]